MRPPNPPTSRERGRLRALLLILAGAVLVLTACSTVPRTKHQWLTFFLDGVPDPNAPPQKTVAKAATPLGEPKTAPGNVQVAALRVVHLPYQNRECQSCHAAGFSNQLRMPKQELCFKCHGAVGDKAAFVHAPVASGDCLMCHQPHSSPLKHLLVEDAPGLCLQCHDSKQLSAVVGHSPGNTISCYTCHDPHSGPRQFFLHPEAPTLTSMP